MVAARVPWAAWYRRNQPTIGNEQLHLAYKQLSDNCTTDIQRPRTPLKTGRINVACMKKACILLCSYITVVHVMFHVLVFMAAIINKILKEERFDSLVRSYHVCKFFFSSLFLG